MVEVNSMNWVFVNCETETRSSTCSPDFTNVRCTGIFVTKPHICMNTLPVVKDIEDVVLNMPEIKYELLCLSM